MTLTGYQTNKSCHYHNSDNFVAGAIDALPYFLHSRVNSSHNVGKNAIKLA